MRKHAIILATLLAAWGCCPRAAATDYAALRVKAARFYHYDEWPSALAMYSLMLDRRPDVPDTYAHAIVAAGMQGDADRQAALLSRSMQAHVPLDSIYDGVRTLAFEQGDARLYETFLENIAQAYPWLARNIDARLLTYYTWRRNGDGMVRYALRMLDGMPDDITYLTALADGYFTLGDEHLAIDTYDKIIAIDPDNYHALLVLGNYWHGVSRRDRFDMQARSLATQYLTRANTLHTTPYVTTLLTT